jgi:hypothetical protein
VPATLQHLERALAEVAPAAVPARVPAQVSVCCPPGARATCAHSLHTSEWIAIHPSQHRPPR